MFSNVLVFGEHSLAIMLDTVNILSHICITYLCLTGHKKKVEIDEEMLAEVINVDTMKTQMEKIIQHLKDDYIKHLSLRSTTGMFISKE